MTDAAVIRRIKSIGVPPAYESVWICPSANGHIQATGLDARGRKQYFYHSKWRELRDQTSTSTSSGSLVRCPRCGSGSPPT
ncbi:hypothetical protein [Bradyrhizobium sp. I1.7.5]|uniref:hypothetical protein n=1 Tax=Bradyrhizobium sp. I1.7.5 TaxID=3156363 RepID=UPI00339ACF78